MTTLTDRMASALHPVPDGEDEATAAVCADALRAWLASDEAFQAAMLGVDEWMRTSSTGRLSYPDTVRAALSGVANAVRP